MDAPNLMASADVRGATALRDHRGPLVDESVVNLARLVVSRVAQQRPSGKPWRECRDGSAKMVVVGVMGLFSCTDYAIRRVVEDYPGVRNDSPIVRIRRNPWSVGFYRRPISLEACAVANSGTMRIGQGDDPASFELVQARRPAYSVMPR